MGNDKIIDKIQKLKAKAESAKEIGNVEEAAIFSAKVSELLQKHNLDIAEINTEDTDSTIAGIESDDLNLNERWKINLLSTICQFNFCQAIYTRHPKGARYTRSGRIKTTYESARTATIVGTPENVEVVKYLFSVLSDQFQTMAKANWNNKLADVRAQVIRLGYNKTSDQYKKPFRHFKNVSSPNIYKNSFYVGAIRGVYQKLDEQLQNAKNENAKVTDLVLVHGTAVQKWIDNKFGNIGNLRNGKKNLDGDAYHKGVKAGRNSQAAKTTAGGDTVATKMIG